MSPKPGTIMGLRALPPVGQRVHWQPGSPVPLASLQGHNTFWLASGTAALALAIHQALTRDPTRREVLLPGYGCPDLVAACHFAGAQPRLVDCEENGPGFDLSALHRASSSATAAIVAVNFLGIRERLVEIHALAESVGAVLIEDCAQWFPEQPSPVPIAAQVLSFGRGKPVNLLGGGALLTAGDGPLSQITPPSSSITPLSKLKAQVFNLLLHPLAYGLISRLPGLALGATRYHPLAAIEGMDPVRRQLVEHNVHAWLQHSTWRQELLNEELAAVPGLHALPVTLAQRSGRLLRYPLLCADQAVRDHLLTALRPLGASPFYGQALAMIDGMAGRLSPPVPSLYQAQHFARRLLTLPLHDRVTREHLHQMVQVIRQQHG